MRKSLLMLAACAAVLLLATATATAASTAKVSAYRAAALKCDHGHSLEAKLNGSSIGFLRATFVPCVVKQLHGSAVKTSSALNAQVAHDARIFTTAKASKTSTTTANNQFNKSGAALCSSTSGDWAWTLADSVPSPTLTYIVLAKEIDQAFFTTAPKLGTNAKAIFGFSFVHSVFFHDGKVSNPLGIAGFVLVCP